MDVILSKKRDLVELDNRNLADVTKSWGKYYETHNDEVMRHIASLFMNSFRLEMETNAKELTTYETFFDFIYHIVRGLTERDREIDGALELRSGTVEKIVTKQMTRLVRTFDKKKRQEEERARRKFIHDLGPRGSK